MSEAPKPAPARKALVGGSAAALALACAFIAQHEGEVRRTYPDINGKLTFCYGSTAGAVAGKIYTHVECMGALNADAARHAKDVSRYLPPADQMPGTVWVALVDLGYNMGGGPAFGRSSMVREAKAGHWAKACDAIGLYVYSGGKDCRIKASRCGGIVQRRKDEIELCRSGLSQ